MEMCGCLLSQTIDDLTGEIEHIRKSQADLIQRIKTINQVTRCHDSNLCSCPSRPFTTDADDR